MNPHKVSSGSLGSLVHSLLQHRKLILQMVKRDIEGKYKGSIIGLGWSFFYPVFMLAVYTFVFSVVFKARWGGQENQSDTEFAVVLFVGLIVHSLFSEVINRAPGLILGNINYVKKVIFPLEILPVVVLGTALFHSFVSMMVLTIVFAILNGFVYWTIFFIPFLLLPFCIMILGFAWFFSSLGVFLRDVGQFIGVATTAMLFLAPIFYPISVLPEIYHPFLMVNPLTFIVEQARAVLIFGQLPSWSGLAIYWVLSVIIAWIGYWWFQKTRKGFADVL